MCILSVLNEKDTKDLNPEIHFFFFFFLNI